MRAVGHVLGRAAVLTGVVAVLGAAAWSLATDGERVLAADGSLPVAGGAARVDEVVAAAPPMNPMPGMGTDDDPVEEGRRRVSVAVTLLAGDDDLAFAVDRFALAVGGEELEPHRDALPEQVLTPGTTLAGTLSFDVPEDAADGLLSYDGGAAVLLAMPPAAGGAAPSTVPSGGHGGGHAQGSEDASEGPSAADG